MTEQEVRNKLDQLEEIKSELEEIIYGIWSEAIDTKYIHDVGSIDDWDYSNDKIFVNWSDSWQYGGHDSGSESFPIELMWTDYKAFFKEQQEIRLKKAKQSKDKASKAAEKAERDLYERLKEKFRDS